MYNYIDVVKALKECIQGINTGLIVDDDIQRNVSLIQIKCAISEMLNIINREELKASDYELKEIRKYVDLCIDVLNIYRQINEIGLEIYKEDYLSEETCKVILSKSDYIIKKMTNILDNKELLSLIIPFIEYATKKITVYHNRIDEILQKGHIK